MNRTLLAIFALTISSISLLSQPVITQQPTDQIASSGSNVAFTVAVSGDGPFTYQWQFNGANVPKIISTVAGNGTGGFSGDNGLATYASLNFPFGIAIDGQDNIFIADNNNYRIRKVDTNGFIITVAGTNSGGFSGDGNSATTARLNSPHGVCVDGAGNYFIADTFNYRIRKVNTNGIITTVGGGGGSLGDGGNATNATLSNPYGVAMDAAGNLYIADTGNRVRKIDVNGIITTFAGTNSSGFSGDGGPATNALLNNPMGVTEDSIGNVYIADYGNNRIRRVDTNGIITTIAGTNSSGFSGDGGPANMAQLYRPSHVACDTSGNLFIADSGNSRIRQIDANGIITTIAGGGTTLGDGGIATNANLAPATLAFKSSGDLICSDTGHYLIRMITMGRGPMFQQSNVAMNNIGSYQVIITSPSGSVTSSVVNLAIVMNSSPQTLVVTHGNPASFSVTAYGAGPFNYQWYFNTNTPISSGTNAVLNFNSSTFDMAGNYMCVVSTPNSSVTNGGFVLTVLTPPSIIVQPNDQTAMFGSNVTFNVTASGTGPFTYQWRFNGTNLQNNNNIISRIAGGSNSGFSGDGSLAMNSMLSNPKGLALDSIGNLFISDQYNNRIRKVDTFGIINTIAGIGPNNTSGSYSGDGGLAINAGLNLFKSITAPGVAIDTAGNLYIADTSNNRIRRVDTNGMISTIAGTNNGYSGDGGWAQYAKFSGPAGIFLDKSGNVYVADSGNNRVRKIDSNGLVTTVVGNGSAGFSGDGGMATGASLNNPNGVTMDGYGNLYIADTYNQRVRKVDRNGIITTLAGTGSASYSGDNGAATNATLFWPFSIVVDDYNNVFIADNNNSRVRMIAFNGVISTVAGNGSSGNSGDGGYATNAALSYPGGMVLDKNGNLYVSGMYGVRKVDLGRVPTLQLNNVGPINGGNYDVVVTSPYGSVTSSVVSLNVLSPPVITTQPNYTKVLNGGSTNISVGVIGTAPFNYQWFSSSGSSAQMTTTVFAGRVSAGSAIYYGSGYTSPPLLHFSGGGGSGVGGYGFVQNGGVVGISFTNQGQGYTSPPVVLVDPPIATVNNILPDQTNAAILFSPATVANATNYFVVISNDYGSVTSSFVALGILFAPSIVNQPVSATNTVGSTASFTAAASGTLPFNYLWYKNATNLVSSGLSILTNSQLSFPVGSLNDAGGYSVVIANSYGSVTSAMANLTVLLPPQSFSGLSVGGGGLQLQFIGTPNYPYILQSATNLTSPVNWQSVFTNPADASGNWNYTVTNSPDVPAGYYRVLGQ
jgi:sugar lactone lactonase YvrE